MIDLIWTSQEVAWRIYNVFSLRNIVIILRDISKITPSASSGLKELRANNDAKVESRYNIYGWSCSVYKTSTLMLRGTERGRSFFNRPSRCYWRLRKPATWKTGITEQLTVVSCGNWTRLHVNELDYSNWRLLTITRTHKSSCFVCAVQLKYILCKLLVAS